MPENSEQTEPRRDPKPPNCPVTVIQIGNWHFAIWIDPRKTAWAQIAYPDGRARQWRGGVFVTLKRYGPACWGLPGGTLFDSPDLRYGLELGYERHLETHP